MPETKHPDLRTGSLTAHIIRLSLPMIVAMLFQTGFSIIDMVFLGMVSSEAIAVVSIVFPVIFFFVSFAMGIGAGLTSFIARAFGAGDREKAGRIVVRQTVVCAAGSRPGHTRFRAGLLPDHFYRFYIYFYRGFQQQHH